MTYPGQVTNGVIILQNGASLPDGTSVQVTPLPCAPGNALSVIAAMESQPHLAAEDIADLQRAIAAGKRPAAALDPFAHETDGPV